MTLLTYIEEHKEKINKALKMYSDIRNDMEKAAQKDTIKVYNLMLDVLDHIIKDISANLLVAALKVINLEYPGTPLHSKKITKRMEQLINNNNIHIVNSYNITKRIYLITENKRAVTRHDDTIREYKEILVLGEWYNSINSYIVCSVDVPTRRGLLARVKKARTKYEQYKKLSEKTRALKYEISDLMSDATNAFYYLDR